MRQKCLEARLNRDSGLTVSGFLSAMFKPFGGRSWGSDSTFIIQQKNLDYERKLTVLRLSSNFL